MTSMSDSGSNSVLIRSRANGSSSAIRTRIIRFLRNGQILFNPERHFQMNDQTKFFASDQIQPLVFTIQLYKALPCIAESHTLFCGRRSVFRQTWSVIADLNAKHPVLPAGADIDMTGSSARCYAVTHRVFNQGLQDQIGNRASSTSPSMFIFTDSRS